MNTAAREAHGGVGTQTGLLRFGVCRCVSRLLSLGIRFRSGFHIQQFNVEHQCGVGRDARNASFTVGQRRWDNQLDFAAFLDVFQAFSPTWDHAVQTE
ncbi:hypothetical protein D3C78_1696500 [compost metagenome]